MIRTTAVLAVAAAALAIPTSANAVTVCRDVRVGLRYLVGACVIVDPNDPQPVDWTCRLGDIAVCT
ncbi:MAG TPA: hypothetical protein VGX28_15265 [Frankiaceae bacterium]|jgi:hypothetical protein|nr:hypothetical protein [Frankiaceae bacterium]